LCSFVIADIERFWYYTRISKISEKIKNDGKPLIVAIFLVAGGLALGACSFQKVAGTVAVSTQRDGAFFISTANGAENASTLFGARVIPPVSALTDDNETYTHSAFSPASGAIKDPGYISSLSR
jgi:hypothetical protein